MRGHSKMHDLATGMIQDHKDVEDLKAKSSNRVPGELIRWQVLNRCNIVTFSSLTRLDFSFLFLNLTDFKGIRAGRHFQSGYVGETTIRQPQVMR